MHVQSRCLRLYFKPIAFLSFPSRKRLYTLSPPFRSRFEVTLNLVILRRSLKDDKQTYKKVMHLPFFCFELVWKPIKGITRKYLGFLMYLWMSFLNTTSGSNQHYKAHLPGTILCLGTKFYSWIRSTQEKGVFLVKSRIYSLCISSTTPGHSFAEEQEAAEAFWNLW